MGPTLRMGFVNRAYSKASSRTFGTSRAPTRLTALDKGVHVFFAQRVGRRL